MRKFKKSIVMCVVCASLINGEFVQADQERNVIQYNEETVSIIVQPVSKSYTAGQKVTAKVTAEGSGLKYQWQYKLPTDKGWINWRGTGANTAETSYNFPASFDGIKLRCVVTDGTGKSVTSGEATYTLAKVLNITGQPESQSYTAGQKVTAKVTAEGSGLKYQWQYKLPTDKGWINWRGTGANTAETSYNFPASFDGIKLRCVVTDGTGKSVTSGEATYTLAKALNITGQPESQSYTAGQKVTAKVTAEGSGLKYQWQYKLPTDKGWINWRGTGANTAETSYNFPASFDGIKLRCVVTDGTGKSVTSGEATYTLAKALNITGQPESQSYTAGQKVTAKVTAEGSGLKYQWQYKLPTDKGWINWRGTGANTAETSYNFPASFDGIKLRCVVTDGTGKSVTSGEATYTLAKALNITGQPESQSYTAGQKVTAKVTAEGSGLKYQWQYKLPTDKGWINWRGTGANTAETSYNFPASFDGIKLRCVVTDGTGKSVTSGEATYTLAKALNITGQPESQSYTAGQKVTAKVTAEGSGLKYQWQYKLPTDKGWTNWRGTGANTAETSYNFPASFDGIKLRCVVTDGTGKSVTSGEATYTLAKALNITGQPESQSYTAGQTVTAKVTAEGSGLKYQWQYKLPTDKGWINWRGTGANTAETSYNFPASFDGIKLRCVVTDGTGKSVTSGEATYTLAKALNITGQPESQSYTAGQKVTAKVTAEGSGLKYQWQYKLPTDKGWINWRGTGANTAETSYNFPASFDGIKLRCVVTDGTGKSVTSGEATYTLAKALNITGQPESQSYTAGQKVTAKVTAEGSGLKYQWQYKLPTDKGWINWRGTGANTAETSYNFPASFDGIKLRCVVTDGTGKSVTSGEATYTLAKALNITGQPESQSYTAGQKVTAKVTAEGSGLKYQWQYKLPTDKGWTNWRGTGANTAETSYNFPASFDGIKLRCVVTDGTGKSVVSGEATYSLRKRDDWELPIM